MCFLKEHCSGLGRNASSVPGLRTMDTLSIERAVHRIGNREEDIRPATHSK